LVREPGGEVVKLKEKGLDLSVYFKNKGETVARPKGNKRNPEVEHGEKTPKSSDIRAGQKCEKKRSIKGPFSLESTDYKGKSVTVPHLSATEGARKKNLKRVNKEGGQLNKRRRTS